MAWFERGVQTLLATVGAFAAFSLMSIAIGTDYWLYSRAYICNATNASADESQPPPRSRKGDLTHSGLWRICCIEGESGWNLVTLGVLRLTFYARKMCLLRFWGGGGMLKW